MPNSVNLPEEIVLDILYRLPAKSLGRCKCVSKPLQTLISDPNFVKTHLSQSNQLPHRSLLVVDQGSLFVVEFSGELPLSGTYGIVSPVRLNFQPTYKWRRAYCSFNGLVLALTSESELFILNPTTQEFKKLPKPYGGENLAFKKALLGFGYDSLTDDYKVVVISYLNDVYVYRFKSDTWEKLPTSPLNFVRVLKKCESGVFLNNSLHWFGEIDSHSSILAFDLADEKFREVPLPGQFDRFDKWALRSTPVVVDGCLCIVRQDNMCQANGRVDVWVMKEYGMESSWIKFTLNQYFGFVNPVHFWGNGEFLLIMDTEEVAICNVKEESSTTFVAISGIQSGGDAKVVVHCAFVDSLVSLKKLHQRTNSLLS